MPGKREAPVPASFRPGVLLQVFVAGQLTSDLLRAELGDTMSGERFALLSVIGVSGQLTPTELARRLGAAPTTVSSWLSRLEAEGLARRRPNPDDGRSQLVELTARGRRDLERSMPAFRRAIERVRAVLGDDVEDVLAAQATLVEALRVTLAENTKS